MWRRRTAAAPPEAVDEAARRAARDADRADYDAFASSGIRLRLFEQALRFFPTGSIIDLGAGHGAFSLLAHSLGWRTTALDARTERLPELPSDLAFIHSDVEADTWDPADYDVVACLGLYYHLSQPMQHSLLARIAGRPLILDTHVATTDGSGWFTRAGVLTDVARSGGELGAYYPEVPHLDADSRKADSLLASFGNDTSFWATLPSLQATLRAHGYAVQWVVDHPYPGAQRTFVVALP